MGGKKNDGLIAHIRQSDNKEQSLWEHLEQTSQIAGQLSEKIGLGELGEILGVLHDFGKANQRFQNYIRSAEGQINPDADEYINSVSMKGKIDHSTMGAQILYDKLISRGKRGEITAQVMAICIASHHSGLIDFLSTDGENIFKKRIEKQETRSQLPSILSVMGDPFKEFSESYLSDVEETLLQKMQSLKETGLDSRETLAFKHGLLIRFLFSCLIDADRLSTADFEFPDNVQLRNTGHYKSWEKLVDRLNQKLSEFEAKTDKNEVDHIRSQVSQACLHYAAKPKGIYELTVPTGGGKTLASLRFALNHALHHKMERIFIIIPYTSIIDQNAREIRKILEDKNEKGEFLENVVLEHHSNLTPEKQTCRQTLLTQNWDAPIVLTTQVQFLETLFGSGTRSVRRMHQLVNSVIIFDEVQTIPIRCVHMFNIALRFLVNSCGATIVLSTATQPLLDKVVPSQRALNISREQHIIRSEEELFNKLNRVQVFDKRKTNGWNDDEVAELVRNQLQERGSVLVIVNTRKSARSLYTTLSQDQKGLVYHLSTNMCPAHRLEVLEMIKRKLLNNQPVICVSTQLIEAGVDIDFGAVIRYLAGLDSIAQAAGRCNRNGKQKDDKGNPTLGQVFIVNPANENITKLVDISVGAEIAQRILDDFNHNPALFSNDRIGLQAIKQYYQYYFHNRKSEMSYQVGPNTMVGRDDNLFNLLSTNVNSVAEYKRINGDQFNYHFAQSLKSAGKMFEVIDSHTQGVIVPYQEAGKDLVSALCEAKTLALLKKLVNKAQKYAVNLFPHELNQLVRSGAIQEVQKESGIYYLDARFYSDNLGWCETAVNKLDTLYYSEET